MRSRLLICKVLICLGLYFAAAANAAVLVTINKQLYQYDTNPRLVEVLAPEALSNNWYWPAAALYRLDSVVPQQLRTELLALVEQLSFKYQHNTAMLQTLATVKRQVTTWDLAKRIMIKIDYDAARLRPEFNPRFDDGEYLLRLSARPPRVHAFGAVTNPGPITHQSTAAIAQYVSSIKPAEMAELTNIIVLQPDGTTHTVGVVYWNQTHIEAMPGAQLFLPLKASLFNPEIEQLNQLLLKLAVHRVLP